MDTPEQPQLYLITPPQFDVVEFADLLPKVLDEAPVACIRLALSSMNEADVVRAVNVVQEISVPRDIALVVSDHIALVEKLGIDGVHLQDAAKSIRSARDVLGDDAIVGCNCGTSRHAGMSAGEAGADYVSFGPVGQSALGDGKQADLELFQWWSEMIEVPVVAEGYMSLDMVRATAPWTDFIALGDEVWSDENPVSAMARFAQAMKV
jgi:thiamine-phosphate pyrophosphorylase